MLGVWSVEVNPFGPLDEYVPPPLDDKVNVVPEQTGLLLDADAVGRLFTVAFVVAVTVHPDALVTVTVYVPVAAVVALLMLVFCEVDVNPFGPVQEKVIPPDVVDVRFNVLPAQIGPLFDADAVGAVATVNVALLEVTDPHVPVTITL